MTHVRTGSIAPKLRRPPRNELVAIVVIAALVVIGGVTAGLALTRDVFSASAFVTQYLQAIERRDVSTALSMPGVLPPDTHREDFIADPQNVLLTAAAMATDLKFSVVSDDEVQGTHFVTVRVQSGKAGNMATTAAGASRDVVFSVSPSPRGVSLFPQWEFTTTPLGAVSVSVSHATYFSVNGFGPIDIAAVNSSVSPQDFEATASFTVFTPGVYTFDVDSSALSAEPVTVALNEPGETGSVSLTATPTPALINRVQKEVDQFFDGCVSQRVLLPSGCPFGIAIDNRVSGEPRWGVANYPQVELRAGTSGWEIVPATMGLTFDADIQSLFDGSITPAHEDISLTISGSVLLTASGDVSVLINRVN